MRRAGSSTGRRSPPPRARKAPGKRGATPASRGTGERRLRKPASYYRTLFERSSVGLFQSTLTGDLLDCNDSFARLLGFVSREDILGRRARDLSFLPEQREDFLRRLLRERSLTNYETRLRRKDGSPLWVFETVTLSPPGGSAPALIEGTLIDITERKRAEDALRVSEERYRLLFERNLAGVYRNTLEGRILDCNDALAHILGFASREELLSHGATDSYFSPHGRQELLERLRRDSVVTNLESCLRKKNGQPVWVLENVSLRNEEGVPILEGTLIDITDRKRAEEQIEFQAYHDALTGLPNRMLFKDRLSVALAHAHRSGQSLAVMFLDLDNFKVINDTLGHSLGDRLLRGIADRLLLCVREDDTVARLGGDEFTLLLPYVAHAEDAAKIAQKILQEVSEPLEVDGQSLYVTTSIGISLYPMDGGDSDTLLKNADNAMYRAKELGRNNYQLCTPAMTTRARERLMLESEIRRALEREEFELYYQPQLSTATGRVVGIEALVRWLHPSRGLVLPADFVPAAEEARLILPLGEWVLRAACRQTRAWQQTGFGSLRVAVNLSARQFQQGNLIPTVERALSDAGLEGESLELEITESVAMQNAELATALLALLRELGVKISVDDFGTAHSSLRYLKNFPVDNLKIDRELVSGLTNGGGGAAILTAVIQLAHGLNLKVIAEGVETEEQFRFLAERGCEEIQGNWFSAPVPAAEIPAVLRRKVEPPVSPAADQATATRKRGEPNRV